MEVIKMSSKGQIVIPLKIREELDINEGSMIAIDKVKDGIAIKKIDHELVEKIRRSLEDIKHGRIKEWKG